jgi:virginiamycin B lyase
MSKVSVSAVAAAALLATVLPARSQAPSTLPDGPGKETVAAFCESCHTFASRVGSGYTADGWRTVMRMMDNHGVTVPKDQVAVATDYLIKNFPEKPKPAGVERRGLPRSRSRYFRFHARSRPHDPLATRDGAIWYTGRWPMCSAGSTQDGAIQGTYPSRRRTRHMGWSRIRPANLVHRNTGQLVSKLDRRRCGHRIQDAPDPMPGPHSLAFDQSGSCGSPCRIPT